MKRKFIVLLLTLGICFSFVACNKESYYGNVGEIRSEFIKIPNTDLAYDVSTKIVYIADYTYYGNYVHSAYYAPNGLPYRYDAVSNKLVEIE